MKKFLMLLAAAILLTANLGATTVVGDCQDNSTMAYYTANYSGSNGCTVGDKIFSGFSVTNAAIWTTVDVLNPDPLHMGFQFGGAFLAVAPGVFTASMNYAVETTSGDPLIEDMLLQFFGASTIPAGGVLTINENIFADAGLSQLLATLMVGGGSPVVFSDSDSWNPAVSKIWVKKDVTISLLSSGIRPGTIVNFSEMVQLVGQTGDGNQVVPEPGTYAMMGAGLLALAFIRRRKA